MNNISTTHDLKQDYRPRMPVSRPDSSQAARINSVSEAAFSPYMGITPSNYTPYMEVRPSFNPYLTPDSYSPYATDTSGVNPSSAPPLHQPGAVQIQASLQPPSLPRGQNQPAIDLSSRAWTTSSTTTLTSQTYQTAPPQPVTAAMNSFPSDPLPSLNSGPMWAHSARIYK